MFVATINRTLKALGLAIIGAEYVLRWLPRGTHQYGKLVRPEELDKAPGRRRHDDRRPHRRHLQPARPTAGTARATWTSTTWSWRRSRLADRTAAADRGLPKAAGRAQFCSSGNTGSGMKSTPSSARLPRLLDRRLAIDAARARPRRNGSCAPPRRTCRRHSRRSRAPCRPFPSACQHLRAARRRPRAPSFPACGRSRRPAPSAPCRPWPNGRSGTRPARACCWPSKSVIAAEPAIEIMAVLANEREADHERGQPCAVGDRLEIPRVLEVRHLAARGRRGGQCRSRRAPRPAPSPSASARTLPHGSTISEWPIGLAAVLVQAALRGGDDEGAVLDRARADQHMPVRLARSGG